MKVAMFNYDDQMGGAAIAARRLAESLVSKGLEVDFFVLHKQKKNKNVNALYSQSWIGNVISRSTFLLERAYFALFEKSKAVRFAFSPSVVGRGVPSGFDFKKYDIVHLHWVNFGFLTVEQISEILSLKIPVVWTMHDMWPITGGCHHSGECVNYKHDCGDCKLYLKNPKPNDISHQLAKRKNILLRNVGHLRFVACSDWLSNRAKSSSICSKSQVISIPNPIDTSCFSKKNKVEAKKHLGLNTTKKHILFVAMKTSVIWKGFSFLLEALKILEQSSHSENYEVIILGNHDEKTTASLTFKIHSLGVVYDEREISTIYNAADVFISSSIQENLPNTIMEAMACDTPVVAFDVGGISQMVDHLKNGFLAQPKNAKELAHGVEMIIQNQIEGLESPRKKIVEVFDKDIVASQYIELYKDLFSKK